jgi:hypothetical protein
MHNDLSGKWVGPDGRSHEFRERPLGAFVVWNDDEIAFGVGFGGTVTQIWK